MLGRNILPEEAQLGRDHEMILSYGLWVRRFRADPGVVGRIVQVNGHDCSIIGVMPAGFDFPMRLATTVSTPSGHMDFWARDAIDPTRMHRDATEYGAIARLRPGISLSQAQQDLAAIAARLARAYPRTNKDRTLRYTPAGFVTAPSVSPNRTPASDGGGSDLSDDRLGERHPICC